MVARLWLHLEPEQHLVLVGEIADDAPQWRRQLFDERRRREDLVILGDLRMLEHIDDLELVSPVQLIIADAPQVGDRRLRLRGLSSDVEFEDVVWQGFLPPPR